MLVELPQGVTHGPVEVIPRPYGLPPVRVESLNPALNHPVKLIKNEVFAQLLRALFTAGARTRLAG